MSVFNDPQTSVFSDRSHQVALAAPHSLLGAGARVVTRLLEAASSRIRPVEFGYETPLRHHQKPLGATDSCTRLLSWSYIISSLAAS